MPNRLLRSAIKKVACHSLSTALRIHRHLRGKKVMVYYKWPDFERKAGAFADLLRRQGFDSEVCSGESFSMRMLLRSSPDLWLGFWNELPNDLLPRNYIFLNAEPLNVNVTWRDMPKWFTAMKNARAVWGYAKSNADFVTKLGVPFRFVPFGYAPYYESVFQKHTSGAALSQDIDVLFVGNLSERRSRLLDELARHGMNVQVVSRANPAHGRQLDEFLVRSKIVLGIHYFEEPQAQIADLARLDHLLSNRLFVLHERPSPDASDAEFERNVAVCDYQEMVATCAYFLARPNERASKAAGAHEWFKTSYALDRFIPDGEVRKLLQEI